MKKTWWNSDGTPLYDTTTGEQVHVISADGVNKGLLTVAGDSGVRDIKFNQLTSDPPCPPED